MAKLTLNTILSGFLSVTKMGQNFDDIVAEFQDQVLYRNNPVGEPNQMENDLDMNSNRVVNLVDALNNQEPITLAQLNRASSTVQFAGATKEAFIATASQTLFTLTSTFYTIGANNLNVYLNGARLLASEYVETSTTSFTLVTPASVSDDIEAVINEELVNTDAVSAANVLLNNKALNTLIFHGVGDPEGVVVAGVGSLYLRSGDVATTQLHIKESGSGSTGWNSSVTVDINAGTIDNCVMNSTPIGQSGPAQADFIDVKIVNSANINAFEIETSITTKAAIEANATSVSYAADMQYNNCFRAASSAFSLWEGWSGNFGDKQFRLRGDGEAFADGSWTGGGADRGECLRWYDDNLNNEDRMGLSVCFLGGVIYPSDNTLVKDMEPIGIISATADSIGNASALRWHGKYVTDDFGRKVFEEYTQIEWTEILIAATKKKKAKTKLYSYQTDKIPEGIVIPKDARIISMDDNGDKLIRCKNNENYDTSLEYVSRLDRQEYDVVGMVGLVAMRNEQRTADNWVSGEVVSSGVTQWLIK